MCQRTVLGRSVGGPVIDVHGKIDAARSRPVRRIVKARCNTCVEAVSERCQKRCRAERKPRCQHNRAVFFLMPTIGIAPENAGRAQRKACQCQHKDRREPQEREIQRAAHIGTDRGQLRVQRVAAVLPLIAGDGQRQGIGPAGKIQTADQTASRCRCSLPAPALAGCRAGLIRGSHIKLEQDIFLLGGITVRQRDQPVQLQVIDLKAEICKFQHGAVPLQRQRCSGVRVVCQVRPQVHRRIAAGCQPA